MPHINLLPWREELRRERQRQFINVAVGASIVMLGVVLLTHIRFSTMINEQDVRNTFLQEEITRVDKEIAEIETLEKEKEALLARMTVIQQLQSSRPEVVHLFDEVAQAVPDKLYLLKMSRKGTQISLEGVADSNDYVSEFMRKLNASPWLTNPKLTVIESGKSNYPNASWFQLEVTQTNADAKKEAAK
jgi:type IV pilus assembly protein PilN